MSSGSVASAWCDGDSLLVLLLPPAVLGEADVETSSPPPLTGVGRIGNLPSSFASSSTLCVHRPAGVGGFTGVAASGPRSTTVIGGSLPDSGAAKAAAAVPSPLAEATSALLCVRAQSWSCESFSFGFSSAASSAAAAATAGAAAALPLALPPALPHGLALAAAAVATAAAAAAAAAPAGTFGAGPLPAVTVCTSVDASVCASVSIIPRSPVGSARGAAAASAAATLRLSAGAVDGIAAGAARTSFMRCRMALVSVAWNFQTKTQPSELAVRRRLQSDVKRAHVTMPECPPTSTTHLPV